MCLCLPASLTRLEFSPVASDIKRAMYHNSLLQDPQSHAPGPPDTEDIYQVIVDSASAVLILELAVREIVAAVINRGQVLLSFSFNSSHTSAHASIM